MKQFLMKVVLCCGCLSFGVVNAMDANNLVISSTQETQVLHEIIGLMGDKSIEERVICEAINSYLSDGFDINARYGSLENTLLHIAVLTVRYDVAKFLIGEEIDVNIINKTGDTALHFAAGGSDVGLIELLSKRQEDINLQDGDGCTAIYNAAYQLGSYEIQTSKDVIGILLDNEADPTIGRTLGLNNPINAIGIAKIRKAQEKERGKDVSQYQEVIDLMQSYVPQQ